MADEIKCKNCEASIAVGADVGLVGLSNNPEEMHVVCMSCHAANDFSNIPELKASSFQYTPEAPLRGQFKPCKTPEQIMDLRNKSYNAKFWVGLEEDLFSLLQEYGEKFIRFSISSRTFKGYKFVFHWEQGKLEGMSFPGNSSTTKPPMNVYQVHRLKQMGLEGQGDNPREWELRVSGDEASHANIVRILTHVLEFGYMIDVSRIDALTPILDV